MSDAEEAVDAGTLANLSAFERDVLWILSNEGEQKGVDIRLSLEEYYDSPVNHGQLYPNLDDLVEAGFVDKGKIDGRTNSYALTEAGRRALTGRQAWQAGDTEGGKESDSATSARGGETA